VDERRARIHDDLRDLIGGELYFEPLDRAPYAHDASVYEVDPLGVVVPRTEDDVVTAMRYAAENRIPVHARGAGTDTGGGALGPGLVLDLGRHLRRIIAIEPEHVVVEAGVVSDHLNAQLANVGRRLEPIPRDADVATLGGIVAVDSAGGRSMRYGSTGAQVERLRVVLAGGERVDLGYEPWPTSELEPSGLIDRIVRKLQVLYRRGPDRLHRGRSSAPRDRAGYALDKAADEAGIHLARLVAGSEGTLAVVTQAMLRTVPLPGAQAVILLPFFRLSQAAAFVPELLGSGRIPSSCDLLDRRSLRLARDADRLFREAIGDAAESVLVVEYEESVSTRAAERVRTAIEKARRTGWLAGVPTSFTKRADCERLLGWRRPVESRLMRLRGPARPVSVFDDVAVPPERLAGVLERLQRLFQASDLTWTMEAYAGEGRLRLRPFLDLSRPADRERLEPLTSGVYDIVLEAGGTISASQACGLVRTQFIRRQFGELIQAFREIKDAFDPMGQLNPGKVIGDDPHLMTRDLRPLLAGREPMALERPSGAASGPKTPFEGEGAPVPGGPPADQAVAGLAVEAPPPGGWDIQPALIWRDLEMLEVASACHGCGICRTSDPALRMCPSFRSSRMEAASPRAQANLLRQIATGAVDPRLWGSEELRAHADLCIHCKLCKPECLSGVDVSSLMVEAKAAYVEKHGLAPRDWVFSRLEVWARLASRLPIVSNFLLTRRWARGLMERLLGVSRHRVLPRVCRTPFTRRAARLGLDRPRPQQAGPRVVYFVDLFANYYDQELAEATVSVLRHAGVNVYLPPKQRSSGMASLIVGDVDHAREHASTNLRVLANAVRDGYTVVCSEPTAALMLREEYAKLTEDLDAELVAAHTMELGQYLLGLSGRGQLPSPEEPLHARVGYHQPCHLRALDVGTPGLELLRGIPELDVEFIDRGCSGMGGTYGLARDRFRSSLRAGRGLLKRLRDDDIDVGATECGACRIQMEQGSVKRTLHPVKLLNMAYGLDPLLRRHFKDAKPRNVMS
jgi:FAD/FMN-containing dehydrogenase/Fe-S oxidoreductase